MGPNNKSRNNAQVFIEMPNSSEYAGSSSVWPGSSGATTFDDDSRYGSAKFSFGDSGISVTGIRDNRGTIDLTISGVDHERRSHIRHGSRGLSLIHI